MHTYSTVHMSTCKYIKVYYSYMHINNMSPKIHINIHSTLMTHTHTHTYIHIPHTCQNTYAINKHHHTHAFEQIHHATHHTYHMHINIHTIHMHKNEHTLRTYTTHANIYSTHTSIYRHRWYIHHTNVHTTHMFVNILYTCTHTHIYHSTRHTIRRRHLIDRACLCRVSVSTAVSDSFLSLPVQQTQKPITSQTLVRIHNTVRGRLLGSLAQGDRGTDNGHWQ